MASRTQNGRYRELEVLRSGGLATVMLAEDTLLGRRVALKRVHAASDLRNSKRLRREALVGASLNHPNIVAVYDAQEADDGDVVIVMQYIAGDTLRELIRTPRGGPAARDGVRPDLSVRVAPASSSDDCRRPLTRRPRSRGRHHRAGTAARGRPAAGGAHTGSSPGASSSAPPSATPGGAAASSNTGADTPAAAVQAFYEQAALHHDSAAWQLADANMRSQLAGFGSFQAQMSPARSITRHRVQTLGSANPSSATVALQTTSVLTNKVQQRAGTARTVRSGNGA